MLTWAKADGRIAATAARLIENFIFVVVVLKRNAVCKLVY
jgi:hypothetical protein